MLEVEPSKKYKCPVSGVNDQKVDVLQENSDFSNFHGKVDHDETGHIRKESEIQTLN